MRLDPTRLSYSIFWLLLSSFIISACRLLLQAAQ